MISDHPAISIVNSTAELFHAQRNSPTQLKQVLRHILNSVEFRSSWGEKTKRPFEIITSAFRAGGIDFEFTGDDDYSSAFYWLFEHIGQPLFKRHSPDGYPDTGENWLNSSTMIGRWRLLNWLSTLEKGNGKPRMDVVAQTPAEIRSATALVDFWIERILGRPVSSTERGHFIDFMAQGQNPNLALPIDSDPNTQKRLSSLVALILMSPEFQRR